MIYSPDNYEVPQQNEEFSNNAPPPDSTPSGHTKPSIDNTRPGHGLAPRSPPRHYSTETVSRPAVSTPVYQESYDHDDVSVPSDEKTDSPYSGDGRAGPTKQQESVADNRTIVLKGIPDRATHADVVSIIRGGTLVDVFVRSRERTASISFVDSKAAQEFLVYAKRQHLCILDKPVSLNHARFYGNGLSSSRLKLLGATASSCCRTTLPLKWRMAQRETF